MAFAVSADSERKAGATVAACGVLVAIVVCALPVRTKHASTPTSKLDEWMPTWQFDERHSIHVDATAEKIFDAIHAVRADEVFLVSDVDCDPTLRRART